MNDRKQIQRQLRRTEAKLKLAVVSGNWRDAQQFAGEAARLEQELSVAKDSGSHGPTNIVGRAFVNDETKKSEE